VKVMENSGSSLDKYTATILFGLIRLCSCFLGSYLIKRVPRRPLFIVSSLSVSLGMGLLGTAAYFNTEDGTSALGFLPLISVMVVAVGYQAGLGPIPWSYTSELYPVDVRGHLSGLSNCIAQLYISLVIKTFPSVQSNFTPAGGYWFYGGVGILAAVFGATVLPDTKGKTLSEVSEYFTTGCCVFSQNPSDADENQEAYVVKSEELTDLIHKV